MKKCAGFCDDLLKEGWEERAEASLYEQTPSYDDVVQGLNWRRWVMLKEYARTITEQKILEILGNEGKIKDAAREVGLCERRVRQITKAFLARVISQASGTET